MKYWNTSTFNTDTKNLIFGKACFCTDELIEGKMDISYSIRISNDSFATPSELLGITAEFMIAANAGTTEYNTIPNSCKISGLSEAS